jgi:hypothetical protein
MALYPGAVKKLIAPGSTDPPIIVVGVILHVDAGNSSSLYNYFNGPSGGIESHFHIPKTKPVEQYRDTGREADANLKANSFIKNGKRYGFISVETQGLEREEWNAYQIGEIKKLLLWAHETHGVPLRRCPAWDQGGVGYHTMWGAPSQWTPVAKSCPGPARIKQFNNIIVPWLKTAATPSKPPSGGTMAFDATEVNQIRAACQAENEEYAIRFWIDPTGTGTGIRNLLAEMKLQLDRIEDDTDSLATSRQLLAALDENVNLLASRPALAALTEQGLLPKEE